MSVADLAGAVNRIDMSLEPELISSNGEPNIVDEGGPAEQHGHRLLGGRSLEPSVQILARRHERLLRRARGVCMEAVDAARDALNVVVSRRLTPEQRGLDVYPLTRHRAAQLQLCRRVFNALAHINTFIKREETDQLPTWRICANSYRTYRTGTRTSTILVPT